MSINKRTIATVSTLAIITTIGVSSIVVLQEDTETHKSVVSERTEDFRASRDGVRTPLISEVEQNAIDKRYSLKAQDAKRVKDLAEQKARAKARAKKIQQERLAAAAERARVIREQNRKAVVTKPRVKAPVYNHTAPGGIAACIRKYESGGNYRALNSSSGASGAYQFLDSTWQSVTGLSGKAMNYSPSQQDAAFWKLWNNGAGANQWVTSPRCM